MCRPCSVCAPQLLQYGADVSRMSRSEKGGGALHAAVRHFNDKLLNMLLKAGACPFVENRGGTTAMDAACARGRPSIVRILESKAIFRQE